METMLEVMEKLKKRGFTKEFMVKDGSMKARSTDFSFEPKDVKIIDKYRFEGESNPDDMSILYALETRQGHQGLLVHGYGVSGDPDVDEFLMKVQT